MKDSGAANPFAMAKQTLKFLKLSFKEHHQVIYLDYPVIPKPRYGHGKVPHEDLYALMNENRSCYMKLIETFVPYSDSLSNIPLVSKDSDTDPFWDNSYIGGLNAAALYCFPALRDSRLYLEIGSGNSTKFVRKSIVDNNLSTRIVSIDPHPRAEIDAICDRVIRQPLEETDLSIFDDLGDGDILMFDGSHRCFQNSDVSVFFLEILPRLHRGVLVYIDDIYLPYDYPPEWSDRFYSEQYLLAVLLMADHGSRYKVVLPHVFIEEDEELSAAMNSLWTSVGVQRGSGNGLWLEIVN